MGLAVAVQAVDQILDGLDIRLLADQLADIAQMAFERTTGGVTGGLFQRGTQLVGQLQLVQLCGLESDEAAAKLLIGMHLALDLTLALLVILLVFVFFGKFCHGCCPRAGSVDAP